MRHMIHSQNTHFLAFCPGVFWWFISISSWDITQIHHGSTLLFCLYSSPGMFSGPGLGLSESLPHPAAFQVLELPSAGTGMWHFLTGTWGRGVFSVPVPTQLAVTWGTPITPAACARGDGCFPLVRWRKTQLCWCTWLYTCELWWNSCSSERERFLTPRFKLSIKSPG